MRQSKITPYAIELWNDHLLSLRQIAKHFGVTASSIRRYLKKNGIDTSKEATSRILKCAVCDKKFKRHRCQIRNTRTPYCSQKCYYKAIENINYFENRTGQRKARKFLRSMFWIDPTDVIHHRDGNNLNNDIDNLMVFKNHSEHMRWHRAGGIESNVIPLFDGKGRFPCLLKTLCPM